MGTVFSFSLVAPPELGRRAVSEAISAAVGELRAIDTAFSPYKPASLVSRVRRGELQPEEYPPPLAEVVLRCTRMRALTDGWFDAWAVSGGFDPSGLVKGWAIDLAAGLLREHGIDRYAISGGGDMLLRGLAPHGGPWRVGIRNPANVSTVVMVLGITDGAVATSGGYERGGHVVNPHTGEPIFGRGSATVVGPELATADAYATALFAAGEAGLAWFPYDGYEALMVDASLTGTFTDGIEALRVPATLS